MGNTSSSHSRQQQPQTLRCELHALAATWTSEQLRQCSLLLRTVSARSSRSAYGLTRSDFGRLLQLDPDNPLHAAIAGHWFAILSDSPEAAASSDSRISGLDFLAALALCLHSCGHGLQGCSFF